MINMEKEKNKDIRFSLALASAGFIIYGVFLAWKGEWTAMAISYVGAALPAIVYVLTEIALRMPEK